ncbi:MAG: 50S ribosomal protein L23 [Planctomycetes bacterium]|nr:50S ribosomal protein L23 [Planctomycetota bacterium]
MEARNPYEVVKRPLITEKAMGQTEYRNQYSFVVARDANKIEIKRAVEQIFDVRVASVNTQNRAGKIRRVRFRVGRSPAWKKAIVTLHPDDRIDLV